MTEPMLKVGMRAVALVGQGYIYGAKGQSCSPAFRARQAEQYPDQAGNILGTGAKWDGRPVWDCAQLTRAAAKEAGVTLPSGATSQWNKGPWARKGDISTMPKGEVVFLYRRQKGSDTVMAHTGIAIGDGTCVHARGTAYGVVRQNMADYLWTHWASPWAEDGTENKTNGGNDMENGTIDGSGTLKPGSTAFVTGGRLALRPAASTGSGLLFWMPDGTKLAVLEDAGEWCRVRHDRGGNAYMGWCMSQYLSPVSGAETIPDDQANGDNAGSDGNAVHVPLSGKHVFVTENSVNVRSGPDTAYTVLARANRGDAMPYVATADAAEWHAVEMGGRIGWISGKYAEVKES